MARKAEPKADVIFLKNVADLVKGLDTWLKELNEGNRGPQWTRTSLARAALDKAIRERTKGEAP